MMPGMTGYEVCCLLREKYQSNELPVVMVTAKNRIEDLVSGFQSGANDYLPKPFAREELLARVETQLNLKRLDDESRQAEEDIRASLKEKEVLLREIHHRVKNNMQVISSLLNLQADQIKDDQYIEMFSESKNRIKSMGLVHEKLYLSQDIANIDFGDYIKTLANSLFSFYETVIGNISLHVDVKDVVFGVDTAIPCGLVINELLSNTLKHAFPEDRKGEIKVTLKKGEDKAGLLYDLTISDNGIGMPKDLDIRKTETLGLQLVTTLVENQLRGTLEMVSSAGTEFHIRFGETKYKKRF